MSSAQAEKNFNFNINTDAKGLKQSILNHLKFTLARDTETATKRDWWIATCHAIHDRILERFNATMRTHHEGNARRVYYLSLEYLMGRMLNNNIWNSGLHKAVEKAMKDLGLDLEEILDEEHDMGLGNGGLGRLAACFLDSLATLNLPAVGYGIYYEFGLFRQEIIGGKQVERPDSWRSFGCPWEIRRPEYMKSVRVYGRVDMQFDEFGNPRPKWIDTQEIMGLPYDIPICGYGAETVNFLRLWESRASQDFNLDVFNDGGYVEAVREKAIAETISKVLYPNDNSESGKELRLVQQYFFVSCSLQDVIRRWRKHNSDWAKFHEKNTIQLNDTHPAVAVAELMRLLVDEEEIAWDEAWSITRKVFNYTNHTLMPEALEKWSVPLFEKVLPRHLQIIYELNRRFLEEEVEAKWPGNNEMKQRLSLIEEGSPKMIRMAYLSVIGSTAVNGVAALHTRLLKEDLFKDFDELYPGKLQNKTNGITPRRWLQGCNPELSSLITDSIGDGWQFDLDKLRGLDKYADDSSFRERFMEIKHRNKEHLAQIILDRTGEKVDPHAIFDVQIKRLHEYKRQHLNLLHILHLYRQLLQNPDMEMQPRVFLFGAKAAPGYYLAKRIIHAINAVGAKINHDDRIKGKLKVLFMPNYRVTLAERMIPAADISEQISTAGKEASGTGNMKFALNGALTVGTLDGANVEIREEVGPENIFIFGLTVEEVEALRARGYNPWDVYYQDEDLRAVVDWVGSNYWTPSEPEALKPIKDSLLQGGDPYLALADFRAYVEAQRQANDAYADKKRWARMAIYNTARVGKFSSDRTIAQYAKEIWNLNAMRVK
ncbi:MAG: glycogen/starch/alpha-glucan phosphorylase [Verrucomicrobiota bacterium JB022]|nr:glycogen/starch/alpha-glucan phosphorylase [Verrucomicrobiota bacterium JB022]